MQTWVTKIINHHGIWATLICSQASICLSHKNLWANTSSTCLLGWLGVVWILHTIWCSWRTETSLGTVQRVDVNQRWRSNLGFWTLLAENYCSSFYEKILLIYSILVEFCQY